jgi:hypothetical protein
MDVDAARGSGEKEEVQARWAWTLWLTRIHGAFEERTPTNTYYSKQIEKEFTCSQSIQCTNV